MLDPYELSDDDLKALQESGAPELCPACGETDCDQTCAAYMPQAQACPRCHGFNTYHYGWVLDEEPCEAHVCLDCNAQFGVPILPDEED